MFIFFLFIKQWYYPEVCQLFLDYGIQMLGTKQQLNQKKIALSDKQGHRIVLCSFEAQQNNSVTIFKSSAHNFYTDQKCIEVR